MDKRILIGGATVIIIAFMLVILLKGRQNEVAAVSNPDINAKELYAQALELRKDGEIVQAKESYKAIIADHPDFMNVEKVQNELENVNMELIFSNVAVPDKTVIHEVVTGDTLGNLAKKYGTTIELIKRSNGLTSNVIRIGQKLRVWTGKFNIFIDKSQNLLTLKDGDEVLKVYSVSTGAGNITPVGSFTVATRLVDPVWFNKGIVVPPESPQNVLGTRWLGFDIAGYGIHGTVEPETIGQQVTAGCVRMRNSDVEELYSIIPRGTRVVIVD